MRLPRHSYRVMAHRPNIFGIQGGGDWLVAARRAFDRLADRHKNVFIVGFSMGSLLATVVAQERGLKVAGLVAIAVPLELDLKSQTVLKIARKVPIDLVVPFVKKDNGPDVSDPGVAAAMPSYDRTPIAAAVSMLEGQALAADRASRLAVPVLVLHGRHDHVAPVRNARVFYDLLQTPSRRLIIYPKAGISCPWISSMSKCKLMWSILCLIPKTGVKSSKRGTTWVHM